MQKRKKNWYQKTGEGHVAPQPRARKAGAGWGGDCRTLGPGRRAWSEQRTEPREGGRARSPG